MKFTTEKSDDGSYYWTATARNGHKTAGARGYDTNSGARRAARAFVVACRKLREEDMFK